MNREKILEELKQFKVVAGHGRNYDKLTDKDLEVILNFFKTMSEEANKTLVRHLK